MSHFRQVLGIQQSKREMTFIGAVKKGLESMTVKNRNPLPRKFFLDAEKNLWLKFWQHIKSN